MIYIAFVENIESKYRNIKIFNVEKFSDFSKWLSYNEPQELYVSETREEILKYIERLVE